MKRQISILTLVVMFLSGMFVSTQSAYPQESIEIHKQYVLIYDLFVFSSPQSDTDDPVAEAYLGTKVEVFDKEGDYYQIKIDEYTSGWVHKNSLSYSIRKRTNPYISYQRPIPKPGKIIESDLMQKEEGLSKNEKMAQYIESSIKKEIVRLEAIVKPLPATDYKGNLEIYELLLKLDPKNTKYQKKVSHYESKLKAKPETKTPDREKKAESDSKPEIKTTSKAPSSNSIIYQAQKTLKGLTFDPGPIDGIWGNATKRAVTAFQKQLGLQVTGKLDERTKKELGISFDKTAKQAIAKVDKSSEASYTDIIGRWKGEGSYNWTTTVHKENGKLIMIAKYHDGSVGRHNLKESRQFDQTRYDQIDNDHGEYYRINHSGDLEIYDLMGLITTQHRIR